MLCQKNRDVGKFIIKGKPPCCKRETSLRDEEKMLLMLLLQLAP